MVLPDVSVLVNAFRADSVEHERCRDWVSSVVSGEEAFGLSDSVLSGYLRITKNPRGFSSPNSFSNAMEFVDATKERPDRVSVVPKDRHGKISVGLCKDAEARGDLVSDAYHAALAIETGSEWATLDGDFARFPGLQWSRPAVLHQVVHQRSPEP